MLRLTCQTPGCDLPFAVMGGGAVIIRSRHHGEIHINVITPEEFIHMWEEYRRHMLLLRPAGGGYGSDVTLSLAPSTASSESQELFPDLLQHLAYETPDRSTSSS